MITAAIALALSAPVQQEAAKEPDCSYDHEAMLALDYQSFDQDLFGGWRPLVDRGCYAEAAELIREWRYINRSDVSTLYWHEAQMRAFAGQIPEALALFQLGYKSPVMDADFGFNHYVDGTIAFLVRDRAMFDGALTALQAVPVPEEAFYTTPEGEVRQTVWPPNLSVMQAMGRCWDLSYREAYRSHACHGMPEPGAEPE